jgi:nitroreductase
MKEAGVPQEDITGFIGMVDGFIQGLPSEQVLPWAQRQLYLALGNAINGAKSLGFDSCPMEGFNPAEYKKIMKLPENLHPTALCPIGYAADTPRQKIRFQAKDIVL